MAVRRMSTFGLGMHLLVRRATLLKGIGRTRRGRYGQGGNEQNSGPEVRNEAEHFPGKKHVPRDAALIFRAKSGERWRL